MQLNVNIVVNGIGKQSNVEPKQFFSLLKKHGAQAIVDVGESASCDREQENITEC